MGIKQINGFPIVDATKSIVIEVTKRDAGNVANRKEPGHCVIAQACKRHFGNTEVRVHMTRIYVRDGDEWVRYAASRALEIEIIAFDRGGTFQPGEYQLYKPWASIKLGVTRSRKPRKRGPHRSPYLPKHVFENVRTRPTIEG